MKRKQISHRRLLIYLAILNMVAVALIAVASIMIYSQQIRKERAETAESVARSAANLLNGDEIATWMKNGPDENYEKNRMFLQTMKDNTPNLMYLYVYQILEDGCHVVFDTDAEDLEGEAFGTVIAFDNAFEPYLEHLLKGERIDIIESRDKYGWLLTCYEPVTDNSGKTVAYVGADMSMTEIFNTYVKFINIVILIALTSLLACILISSKLSINYYNAEKMKQLEEQRIRDKQLLRELVESFAKVIDLKDQYTQGHSTRVAKYTSLLAKELGYSDEEIEKFYNIALLHDIGKIGIPDEILNKPGSLTDDEYQIMKSHTTRGYEVLKNISLMPDISIGALYHHERPDGKGYPEGLKEEKIPRVAQIIGVADTFDAMYSTRKYRPQMQFDKVVSIIKEVSGTQLEPDVVDAFMRLVEKGEIHEEEL